MKRDKMCWIEGDFDNRCQEWSPELIKSNEIHFHLNPLIRDDHESTDTVVHLQDIVDPDLLPDIEEIQPDGSTEKRKGKLWEYDEEEIRKATLCLQPIRIIRRRPAEFTFTPDEDDKDEEPEVFEMKKDGTLVPYVDEENEDELDDEGNEELDENGRTILPRDKYDLLAAEREEYSAPWFPYLRDKRLRGVAEKFELAVHKGVNGRYLYLAIQDALKAKKINLSQVRRIWELYHIEQFMRQKKQGIIRITL